MIILGIDPGTTSIGYAILDGRGYTPQLIEAGLFRIRSASRNQRLLELNKELNRLLKKHKPDTVAIEQIFFSKNQKTAISVAEARGAILLITLLAGLRVCEYTPLEVKKTVTGYGRADKSQIIKMVRLTLPNLSGTLAGDDTFDAVAIALTGFYKLRSKKVEL